MWVDLLHGVAGGMAGIAVDCVFYPLETIKTRIMADSNSNTLSQFKGFSAQMIVSFPYSFTFFIVYEFARKHLQTTFHFQKYFSSMLASALSEIIANIVRNPFQIIKQQMMVGKADKILQSFRNIYTFGGTKAYYIGYRTTIIRDIIFSSIQLPFFQYFRRKQLLEGIPVLNSALSGMLAAIISGFLSCPFDVIKTVLMTQDIKTNSGHDLHSKNQGKHQQKGINSMDAILGIYQRHGIKGYFRGVLFRCGILGFGGIVYFGALQKARIALGIQN